MRLLTTARLLSDDQLRIVAPCGLSDLFNGILRRNPRRVSQEIFGDRLRKKRIVEVWPPVRVVR